MLLVLNILLFKKSLQSDYYRLQYEEIKTHKVNANNVIIGTSHATHGIQPLIINKPGNTFFNFALNGANPEFYLLWYKALFKPYYKKPKHMIIAVDYFLFDRVKLWRKYEQDAEYFPNEVYWNDMFTDSLENQMLFNNRYPVLKYRKSLVKELLSKNNDKVPLSEYKDGFIPCFAPGGQIERYFPQYNNVDEELRKNFEKLIQIINGDQIKIIFVITPTFNVHPEEYKSIAEYAYFDSLASRYSIPVLNYNTERPSFINKDSKYYADGGHLNSVGSIEFSKMLKQDLEAIIK